MKEIVYINTRDNTKTGISFTQALLEGIDTSGGLFVPQSIPSLTQDDFQYLMTCSYPEKASYIYKKFKPNINPERIDALMAQAYSSQFDHNDICPITKLKNNQYVLELWHGPTSAFKDMALQCLPLFFEESLKLEQSDSQDRYHILVATSGDTGKAALEGFKDRKNIAITVLYPHNGVSDIQYKQMATQKGDNVSVYALEGNFDDCQTIAKQIFADTRFSSDLYRCRKEQLSSANSINWGRLLPQIVYYVAAYCNLVNEGEIEFGDALDVCVPTGNFGNILAAYYAKCMGVPYDRLICASNANCVLADFIQTGTYDISDREFVLTLTPSMDILISSNLERQLFELTQRDTSKVSAWMHNLRSQGSFSLDSKTFEVLKEHFVADFVDDAHCLERVRKCYEEHAYLVDPHTAVALEVADRLQEEKPVLIASTAHWGKFGESIYKALHKLGSNENLPDDVVCLSGAELNRLILNEVSSKLDTSVPKNLDNLDNEQIRFTTVLPAECIAVEEKLLGK